VIIVQKLKSFWFYRIVAKNSDQQTNVEVKIENDTNSNAESLTQKPKKIKDRSTTQVCI